MFALAAAAALAVAAPPLHVTDASPLVQKAHYLQQDLIHKHLLEGLYVSIVPVTPPGKPVRHTVDQQGNVIHAGVWTGRYLAGVGYQYAATHDPWVRKHGWDLLRGLHRLQAVTGKPGLLARGYVKGHGPVDGYERGDADDPEWHQGQGRFANYRWHGDVSVDNFNAVLYGYAIYYDLAADAAQKRFIARDVDMLMSHLLQNHCRIIDVDGKVTLWGHIGIDPDPSQDDYYRKQYARYGLRYHMAGGKWTPPLHAELMLLPDLLIAHHVTGKQSYLDFYHRVIDRFRDNPDFLRRDSGPLTLKRLARIDHSSEGQAYEALFNLIRYEHDPGLLKLYRSWLTPLWDVNWMEGNSLFAYMTAALMGVRAPGGAPAVAPRAAVPHMAEGLKLAKQTLQLYPLDRVLRPVMNSRRTDIEQNPYTTPDEGKLAAKPLPINVRPLDNEYAWKGNPYQLDGWLKPDVAAFVTSCDDPMVAWFVESGGKVFMTRDGWKTWQNMSEGLRGARVSDLVASPSRTFVLWAKTDQGVFATHDGGMSWRPSTDAWPPATEPQKAPVPTNLAGWRIPVATYAFETPRGLVAGGPGGCYLAMKDGSWRAVELWPEYETGAADYLHAYWMGRYYGWLH